MIEPDVKSRHGEVCNVVGGTAAVAPTVPSSLAALLTGRILQDGEIVLFILKPSRWFIVLSGLRFAAAVVILMIALRLYDQRIAQHSIAYIESGMCIIAGRVAWALFQWMSRLYILTDLRVITLSGVFSTDVYDCPLRKIARTRIIRSTRERITRLGTIEIIPGDDQIAIGYWSMISKPLVVHDQLVAAINKSKQIISK